MLLSLNALFWADEFYFRVLLREMSIWEVMHWQYRNWDGRFLSLNALLQLQLIALGDPRLAAGVWTFFLWIAAWLTWRIFRFERDCKVEGGLVQVSILFCLLWLGFSPVLAETLYWVTGGIYTMGVAMLLLFIAGWYARPANAKPIGLVVGFVSGLLLGLMGVTASLPLMVFLAIEVFLHWSNSPARAVLLRQAGFAFAGLLAGSLVNIMAPGNYVRAGLLDTSFVWHVPTMAVDFVKIGWRYAKISLPMLVAACFALLILPSVTPKGGRQKYVALQLHGSFSWKNLNASAVLHKHKWLMSAMASALPMVVIPDIAGGRTAVYFMMFVFLWVLQWGQDFFSLHEKRSAVSFAGKRVQYILTLLLFAVVILVAASHGYAGRQIVHQVQQRENFLFQMHGTTDTIRVEPIRVSNMPFTVFFLDLLDTWYAEYYGYKSIELMYDDSDSLPHYYLHPRWQAHPSDP